MKTVMLVEDEEFILEGLRSIIDWEEIGLKVVHMAHNGKEALELFEKEPVDIIVTDVEMPVLDGLGFMKALREKNTRSRCIILTGYDEFEYARKAITLDVEDYILKPIDEDKLTQVLRSAALKLDQADRNKAADMEEKFGWKRFLEGRLNKEEENKYLDLLPPVKEYVAVAMMSLEPDSVKRGGMAELLKYIREKEPAMRPLYLSPDSLLLFLYMSEIRAGNAAEYFSAFQNGVEENLQLFTFISISRPIASYQELQDSYKVCQRLQKYRIIDGYGSCIDEKHVKERTSQDVAIDSMTLRKMILKKDREGALDYIEDLFINSIRESVDVDVLYQLALKVALILNDIKVEYKLEKVRRMQDLTEMLEKIYRAEDIFGLKKIFIAEVTDIITYLHTENSQYTPVVRQLMEEVAKNYREDMNLKTLAYKYHMNASYLGQIFQKETGCSFNQYLNNTKNGIAKDLILNTNMKINDIAREVGYPDTSYFYRKFKQCFGVSPASLRDIKKYETEPGDRI
ncbi:MAG: response regulator transcription factor [Eubacteriales bacterium]|nr:response regulator transcription factor [Eubacteriales bacterium]